MATDILTTTTEDAMGYTTYFQGSMTVDPPLNSDEVSYLQQFCETRRMNRELGPLYLATTEMFGQAHDPDIIAYNDPHPDQPGLWCNWTVTDDGKEILWDEGEKFYHSAEWMKYIVENLLAASAGDYLIQHGIEDKRLCAFTHDHVINGKINASGEEEDDRWLLVVEDNVVMVSDAHVVYSDPVAI